MHISWLGNTAIKLQAKSMHKDVTIVIDPYKPSTGAFPRSLTPDIALLSHGGKGAITLSGDPFVLSGPGECERAGVLLSAIEGKEPHQLLLRVDVERMSLGHLGTTTQTLNNAQIDALQGVDILCLPVGGDLGFTPETAAKVAQVLEPRIIIPLAFKSDTDPKAKPVSAFLKEIGLQADAPEKKVIIKKKDLPQEETQVIVLAKE